MRTIVPGDGIDNDCDDLIDEEAYDGIDNDGDGFIDEDLGSKCPLFSTFTLVLLSWFVLKFSSKCRSRKEMLELLLNSVNLSKVRLLNLMQ